METKCEKCKHVRSDFADYCVSEKMVKLTNIASGPLLPEAFEKCKGAFFEER